jgi:hypothetical protein
MLFPRSRGQVRPPSAGLFQNRRCGARFELDRLISPSQEVVQIVTLLTQAIALGDK